jgi:hypothetical protein
MKVSQLKKRKLLNEIKEIKSSFQNVVVSNEPVPYFFEVENSSLPDKKEDIALILKNLPDPNKIRELEQMELPEQLRFNILDHNGIASIQESRLEDA